MSADTLGAMFLKSAARAPKRAFLSYKQSGRYTSLTWLEAQRHAEALANALAALKLGTGERVAILSENRPEWALTDLACQMIGLATVPIYNSLTSDEIRYILEDSGSRVIAVSNRALFEKIIPIHKQLTALRCVIAFDNALTAYADQVSIPVQAMRDIRPAEHSLTEDAQIMAAAVNRDSLASVIYTSGTTGNPKGVMLTHDNFLSNVEFSQRALKMGPSDKHLSFLPLSHVFERMAGHYLMIAIGAQIAYAESMDTVPQNIVETRPTFLLGVPRFYEKIRERVLAAVDGASSAKKGMFYWALDLGRKKRLGIGRGPVFAAQRALAEALVYRTFKSRLGGRLRFGVSGGAALNREVAEFFYDMGVLILEGYGLSETSPVIAVNRDTKFRFGTVGIPYPEIETRISEDGEILTRGRSVMKGYLNKPAETRAAIDEQGWFHTGDLGSIDADGFLAITGRKKELIVTSGGKKVAPRAIEEMLEQDELILRAVLYGEGHKFITALLVSKKEALLTYAKAEKIAYSSYAELLKNPVVVKMLEQRVESLSTNLASYEKIKYFVLLENDFSQAAGELTPTLKIKREVVLSRHRTALEALYNNPHVG